MANKNTQYPHISPVKGKGTGGPFKWRIHEEINGIMYDKTGQVDENKKPFLTKAAAWEYREKVIADIKAGVGVNGKHVDEITFNDVYESFLTSSNAEHKSKGTLIKHDSVWRNHVQPVFGNKKINKVTTEEIHEFIADKYYNGSYIFNGEKTQYTYQYLESLIKLFQLLYSTARRNNWVSQAKYTEMFDKNSPIKLTMPKRRDNDEEPKEVVIYTDIQLKQIENIFSRGDANLLTSYMIARYSGLRKGEIFGLRWSDIDWKEGLINVKKQMQYDRNKEMFVLTKLKTVNSKRDVYMPPILQEYLFDYYSKQEEQRQELGNRYRARELLYDDVDKKDIDCTKISHKDDFINRKVNGELLTINSTKGIAQTVKKELNPHSEKSEDNSEKEVELHYHIFRHTYATECAVNNMNEMMLCQMMGHKSVDVTREYYLSAHNQQLIEETKKQLKSIFDHKEVELSSIYYEGVLERKITGIPLRTPVSDGNIKEVARETKIAIDELMNRQVSLVKVVKKEIISDTDNLKLVKYIYENGNEQIIDITDI